MPTARLINKVSVDDTLLQAKRALRIRKKMAKIFRQQEELRKELMWIENPTNETISWTQLRKELGL